MKYKWSLKKYWMSWMKSDFKIWYYKTFFKWNMGGIHGTLIPDTGKGKYVSVYRKGDIIQILDETGEYDEIRIIPCQYNHGVMVESLKNGKVSWRSHLDIGQLNKGIIYANNIEQLTNVTNKDKK